MRSLLDVNVLIALLDSDHVSHRPATAWLRDNGRNGWASCPITQNVCVRILSHAGYPNSLPVRAVVERLADATQGDLHEFWPDDVSLLDRQVADPARIHGPRQLTDLYLLALAVRHTGRLVTFDSTISPSAISGASSRHILVI